MRELEREHAKELARLRREGRLELQSEVKARRLRESSIAMLEKEISRLSRLLAKKKPVCCALNFIFCFYLNECTSARARSFALIKIIFSHL